MVETSNSEDEPVTAFTKVRHPQETRMSDVESGEQEWLKAAASNPVFAFLNDAAEDVYSLADGRPFHDQV